MAFDITKPSMTDVDWPTCLSNARENMRAVVNCDDFVFGISTGPSILRVRMGGTTAYDCGFSAYSGNGVTSPRLAFFECLSNETTVQAWRVGMLGAKSLEFRDHSSGATLMTLDPYTASRSLIFPNGGTAPPANTTRTNATRVVFFPAISVSTVDYAIGIDTSVFWLSVPDTASIFKFYFNTNAIHQFRPGRFFTSGAGFTGTLVPTVAVAAGFGTTPSVALDAGSTDMGGVVTVTAGTTPGATGSVTVTFGTVNGAYGTNTPSVVITPLDGAAAWDTGVTPKLTACSTTAFTVAFKNAATNFTAAGTYKFAYHVIGK